MLTIPVEPPDKRSTTFVQLEFHPNATRTATAISKLSMQFKSKQRMWKATQKVTLWCSIVRCNQRAHFRERRTAMKSVMNQPQVDTAHDPRDSSRPDIHHGHRSIVRSKSKISEKAGSTYVRNSGGAHLNRNESKLKFRRNHILTPRKNEFRNCRSLSENYRNTKYRVGISNQEVRTYAYDRRHSNCFRGNRPPVLPGDTSSDSFPGLPLRTSLALRTLVLCTSSALRTFSGLALHTLTLEPRYLRMYLSTLVLRTTLAYSTYLNSCDRLQADRSSRAGFSLPCWQICPSSYQLNSDSSRQHITWKLVSNWFQSAAAHITHGQYKDEISLSPPKPNNASWGYHSVYTPVGLGEVLHVWSFTHNRANFNTFTILVKGDATTYPWPASFDEVGATNNE